MSLARVVVTAVIAEGRSKTQVAKDYGVARSWVYELLKRFEVEGEAAFEPRSRKPHSNPRTTSHEVEERILFWRKHLCQQGFDAGAATIAYHLTLEQGSAPAISTIWKVLVRNNLIVASPKKRPRSSYTRFEATQPNETWQSDFTHWKLRNGRGIEILNFIDDHSRLLIASRVTYVTTGLFVVETFRDACNEFGLPASVLSDNGAVFTARMRGGRNAFESEMASLKIIQKNSRPYHPQTCGKVERFHQTLKMWLIKAPKVTSIKEFQKQLDQFRDYYNFTRPHRALDRQTPAHIRMLIHEKEIRIITTSGELLKELTLNEDKNYQPQ